LFFERELWPEPLELSGLLHKLRSQRWNHLRHVVWFRMPLPSDRRAWAPVTLRAVIRNEDLMSFWDVEITDTEAGKEMRIRVQGNADLLQPEVIQVELACPVAVKPMARPVGDGANGYRFDPSGKFVFEQSPQRRYNPDQGLVVGWYRACQR
jgi:hypothetical protein